MEGPGAQGEGTRVGFGSLPVIGGQANDRMTRNQTLAGILPLGVQAGGFQQEIRGEGERRDAVLPNLDVLRKTDTVADSVNQLLAFYEQKGRQEVIQGKGVFHQEIWKIQYS